MLFRSLGELILIDRVSNMTSACGVVDSVEEKADDAKKASFVLGSLEVAVAAFTGADIDFRSVCKHMTHLCPLLMIIYFLVSSIIILF